MKKDNVGDQLKKVEKVLLGLRYVLFIALVVGVYGFLVWRINTLRNAEPSSSSSSQPSPATNIDQATVSKIKQLQDNSVNVQSLFNQARQNPFQE